MHNLSSVGFTNFSSLECSTPGNCKNKHSLYLCKKNNSVGTSRWLLKGEILLSLDLLQYSPIMSGIHLRLLVS